jgi:hypothetical protein
MQRRTFLRAAGVAGLAPIASACARTIENARGIMTPEPARTGEPASVWHAAIEYARWTPSPHNTQPWRLRLRSATEAELYYDPRRLLPTTDPTGAFTMMGLATFVDYLGIATQAEGWSLDSTFSERPFDHTARKPVRFAKLTLTPSSSSPAFDPALITRRQTSRLPYDGRPADPRAMESARAIAVEHGHTLHWSNDADFVKWVVDLNRFTLFDDLDDDASRTELGRWIRATDREAIASSDGLWARCMRFPGWLLRAFFDDHARWGRGWRKEMCGRMLVSGMRGTRTVAWWSGPFNSPEDHRRAGRLLGRTWLEFTRRGVQVHPFGSVITNARAHRRFEERVGVPAEGSTLWILMRLGYSEAAPESRRVPISSILIDESELS